MNTDTLKKIIATGQAKTAADAARIYRAAIKNTLRG